MIKIQSFIRKQLTIKHVKTFCVLNAIIKQRTSSEEKINNIIERFYNVNAFKSSYLLDELIEYREKSILKRIIELAFIYITSFLFLLVIKRVNKLVACLIPMLSYVIYLFLLNLVKKIWIKKFKSGDK